MTKTKQENGTTGEPIEGNNGETFSAIYTTTAEYTDANGDKATIPAGFAVGTTEGINKINKGLVIRDEKGNEFVWIPVTEYLESSYSYSSHYSEPKKLTYLLSWKVISNCSSSSSSSSRIY